MKRLMIVLTVLGLGAGSVSTAAAKPRPPKTHRTVTGTYGAYPAPVTGCNDVLTSFACMIVDARSTEGFFTAEVKDTHGLPVYVEVHSRRGGYVGSFCGRTTEPLSFRAGDDLSFFVGLPVWGIQTDCPQHSVKTTGSIRVTLFNRR